MIDKVFADDFQVNPYWLRGCGPGAFIEHDGDGMSRKADAVVIGCGLTGLSAAHRLAIGGREVVAIDAGSIANSASSMNAGMLGKSRDSFLLTAKAHGADFAISYFKELQAIYDEALGTIKEERIDCDLNTNGRFIGALRANDYARLVREYDARNKHLGEIFVPLPGSAAGEMTSERYFGGIVVRDACTLDPAKYTLGMLMRATRAGVRVSQYNKAFSVTKVADGFDVHTAKGVIRTRDLLLATNGYSGTAQPWASRRLLPVNAYMVATEELGREKMAALLNYNRSYADNTRAPRYMRLSPDGKRLIFGSRTGEASKSSLKPMARKLHADIAALFPQMASVRLSNVWTGRCAVTWDRKPHVGEHDGMYYALGYCFFGLGMAPYLGRVAAERILGQKPQSLFSQSGLPPIPWFAGIARSITTPLVTKYYAWADRPEIKK